MGLVEVRWGGGWRLGSMWGMLGLGGEGGDGLRGWRIGRATGWRCR